MKSGYQVSLMMKFTKNSSGSNGAQGGFKLLWAFCVPNKSKYLFGIYLEGH